MVSPDVDRIAFVIFRLPTSMLFTNDAVGIFVSLFFVTSTDSFPLARNLIPFACCGSVRFSVTVYVPVGRFAMITLCSSSFSVTSSSAGFVVTADMTPFVNVIVSVFVVTGVTPLSLATVKL